MSFSKKLNQNSLRRETKSNWAPDGPSHQSRYSTRIFISCNSMGKEFVYEGVRYCYVFNNVVPDVPIYIYTYVQI